MKRFAVPFAITLALAAPAHAFTFSLPDLSFATGPTTVSTQSCTVSKDTAVTVCK